MVGAEGFEPPTLWSQTRCATRLRYAPTLLVYRIGSAMRLSKMRSSESAEDAVGAGAEQGVEQSFEDPGEQDHRQKDEGCEDQAESAEK
jgi:hypothetical protein